MVWLLPMLVRARWAKADGGHNRRAINQPITYQSRVDGGTETADTIAGRYARSVMNTCQVKCDAPWAGATCPYFQPPATPG
eukprot:COSAG06_NODE_7138_length_2616_cov_2.280095_5_plen_81_part_00